LAHGIEPRRGRVTILTRAERSPGYVVQLPKFRQGATTLVAVLEPESYAMQPAF